MKALSIKQPWAHLISVGMKTIETRTWKTDYRGPLLIVASKKPEYRGQAAGQTVAVANLVDVRKMRPIDSEQAHVWFSWDLYSWVLEDAVGTPWVNVRGMVGLYDVQWPPPWKPCFLDYFNNHEVVECHCMEPGNNCEEAARLVGAAKCWDLCSHGGCFEWIKDWENGYHWDALLDLYRK